MVGGCGISINDFGYLTPRESSIIFNSNIDKQRLQERENWERIRWQTTWLINVGLKEIHRKTPEQTFPFSWDKKDESIRESTPEDFKRLAKKWENLKIISN